MAKKKSRVAASPSRQALIDFALTLPEAWVDHPWGETVAKVRKKVFVFFGHEDYDRIQFSVKLPESGEDLLENDFAEPTGYGLGKSGWVTVSLEGDDVPLGLLRQWVIESYRAVAPKKLIAELDE